MTGAVGRGEDVARVHEGVARVHEGVARVHEGVARVHEVGQPSAAGSVPSHGMDRKQSSSLFSSKRNYCPKSVP
jgi:hypothetical protein